MSSKLAPILCCLAFTAAGAAAAVSVEFKVTHGPILGRPGPTTMSVWVRTNIPGEVSVRYGPDQFTLDQETPPVRTQLEHDNTGVVTISGLQPDTLYHYQAGNGRPGTFRTLPDPSAYRNPEHNPDGLFNFQFEYSSCANQKLPDGTGPGLPSYATLNQNFRDQVLFGIMNGDWLYEEERDTPASAWMEQVRIAPSAAPRIVQLTPAIVGVWANYKLYLDRGVQLALWHQHVPNYFTFDDHELLNDIYGPGEVGYVDRRAVFRDPAVRAWFDYLGWANPVVRNAPARFGRARFEADSDILFDPEADFTSFEPAHHGTLHVHWGKPTDGVVSMELDREPGNPNAGVYAVDQVLDRHRLRIRPAARATGDGTYSIARQAHGSFKVANCEFILLDTRSHRTLHNVQWPDNPDASILGKAQFAWVLETIERSTAAFVFLISTVDFMIPHVGSGGGADTNQSLAKDDAWTVFLAEREELIARCERRAPQQFFFLTGDLHNSFAIKISKNVWEFASGPMASVNHVPSNDEGGRPINGKFKYGPRECEIRWSSYVLPDIPRLERHYPFFCIVQVNNVFNNPVRRGGRRWVAYPHPQVIFKYHDGYTGELRYSETIVSGLQH